VVLNNGPSSTLDRLEGAASAPSALAEAGVNARAFADVSVTTRLQSGRSGGDGRGGWRKPSSGGSRWRDKWWNSSRRPWQPVGDDFGVSVSSLVPPCWEAIGKYATGAIRIGPVTLAAKERYLDNPSFF